MLSKRLRTNIPCNRKVITLEIGDTVFVASLFNKNGTPFRAAIGDDLPEEALNNLNIRFCKVTVA